MRFAPVLALVAAIASLGVWFFVRRAPPSVTPIEHPSDAGPAPDSPPPPLTVGMGSDLASAPSKPRPTRVERAPGLTEIKYGAVTVTLVPPAGAALPKSLSFDAQPSGFVHAPKPLPAEQDDGSWRYDSLPSGRWRIRAFVPGFVDASKDVDVTPDGEATITLALELGGAATWKVALATSQIPELVRVALLDGRGIPIDGTYQTAATTLHASPSSVPALPAEGSVVGLKVGRYRLRASTVDGDPKEQPFEVKAGETVRLEFTLPR